MSYSKWETFKTLLSECLFVFLYLDAQLMLHINLIFLLFSCLNIWTYKKLQSIILHTVTLNIFGSLWYCFLVNRNHWRPYFLSVYMCLYTTVPQLMSHIILIFCCLVVLKYKVERNFSPYCMHNVNHNISRSLWYCPLANRKH